jgi:hypothetical protein
MTANNNNNNMQKETTRRGFVVGVTAFVSAAMTISLAAQPALAMPMITTDEFGMIIRDSPLSIQVVEFSGPKSETVIVRLVDGSSFGLKDIIESSTDPRSPLKVVAECREGNIQTKFINYESILANAPKKKKMYTNERVQIAYEKELAKKERMKQDEIERLAAVAKMGLKE